MRVALRFSEFIFISVLLIYISCNKEYSYEGGSKKNLAPVAKAGNDTSIALPADSAILNGTSSFDADGTISVFLWTKISGPSSCTIATANNASTRVKDLDTGIYKFELKVIDDGGLSSKDTVIIAVDPVPAKHPPVADAGHDQTIILPQNSGLLDGKGSYDPDNDIASYRWTKISGPSSFSILNNGAVQTQATYLVLGVYLFELKVTDAAGLLSKDTVKIMVRTAPNIPPVANAGTNIAIVYNLQTCSLNPSSITLDGRASYDPDGTIVSYQWAVAFADNSSAIISNPMGAVTSVINLVPGTYGFQLVVTDNDGATNIDTVFVITEYTYRPVMNARLVQLGSLSEKRKVSAVGAANGKILFAGGYALSTAPLPPPGPNYSSRVDIYDIPTGTWSTAELSQPRTDISAISSADNIYFAGGTAYGPSSRVDVYNASANSWYTMEMPHAGSKFASIAFGSKIFIAGGDHLNIYDPVTNRWTAKPLSQHRYSITPMLVKGIPNAVLYFMGGVQDKFSGILSSRIDIYDPVTDKLSISELSEPKSGMIAVSGVLAGGTTQNGITNKVEGISGCLFQPNSFSHHSFGKVNEDLVFFIWDGKEKNKFDIYNIARNTWSIGVLDQAITPSLIISVNNIIYVAGTYGSSDGYYDQVWKLEF